MAFNSDVHLVAEVALTSDRARQSAADAFREFTSENEAGSCRDLQMAIGEAATVSVSWGLRSKEEKYKEMMM